MKVLLILVCCLILAVQSVDRNRFKTCSHSGFCSRNREYAEGDLLSPYKIIKGTSSLSSSRYMADIIHKESGEIFLLVITNYKNDIVRVRITEKAPLYPRYEVGDVLLDIEREEFSSTDNSDLIFGKVQIIESPLELRFFTNDNTEVIRANSRGLFNIEHYRTKPEIEEDENNSNDSSYRSMGSKDLWEEKFQSHSDPKPRGPSSISMDFTFLESKHVYGIPEHASSFSLKSTKDTDPYRLYNLDVFEYELDETMALYGSIPLMIGAHENRASSSAVFWLNAAETWIDINHEEYNVDTHWFSESGALEFFVLLGPSPKDVFKQYSYLTGTQELPPLFSIAYHQCRWNYKDQQDVEFVAEKFDEYDIPYDVLWLDIEHTDQKKYFTWDKVKFPEPKKMIDSLADKGRKMVTIVDPHIKRDNNYYIFNNGNDLDLWVKNSDGSTYEGHCWPGGSSYLDFSSEKTRNYWASQFSYDKYEYSTPDLFIWNDMNEPSVFNGPEVTMQKNLIHENNVEHRELHNQFGAWVHQATHDGLITRDGIDNARRSFVLSRAFFAGSQRFGAIWTGDNAASWQHLEASVPMLLSISVSGISFCGADVGGFFGNPSEELLIRWYQAGAYQPFFRAHAHLDTNRREPYLFSSETTSLIRQSIRSRYSLLPYIYTGFYDASISGIPLMRPLWSEYPNDKKTYDIEDEYLLGSSLLVKPISQPGQTSTSVYFPNDSKGWYDIVSLNFYGNVGNIVNVEAPLSKIPVYQRAGSIIPRKERARRSSTQMENDPYTLIIALDSEQQAYGELYYDDGISFDYKESKNNHRYFRFKNNQILSGSIDGKNNFMESSVLIERIVILGLTKPISTATIAQQGFEFSTNIISSTSENGEPVYTIKKPNTLAAYDWRIDLQ